MTNKPASTPVKPKRLSKSKRIQKRHLKQAARKTGGSPA